VMGVPAIGTWLLAPLLAVDAPPTLQFGIVRRIVDRLAETMLALASPGTGIHVVDTRGTLIPARPDAEADSNDWANEVHPNDSGYGKVATVLCAEMNRLGIA